MLTVKPAEAHQDSTARGEDVHLRVAATAERIALVRGLAGDLAAREEFDMDRVEDFRLAVEEACAVLIRQGVAGEFLDCLFRLTPDHIRLRMRTATRSTAEPDRDGFGWHVLETLSDSVRLVLDPPDVHSGLGTMQLEIGVRKHAGTDADAAEVEPTQDDPSQIRLPHVQPSPVQADPAQETGAEPDPTAAPAAAKDVTGLDAGTQATGVASMSSTVSNHGRTAGKPKAGTAAETSGSPQ
ncbi:MULTISPECIES: ATP-binding protein [Actinoalloteichus]|uniref:Anti-sigma regulatory factor (Ser/Thr protein kinase) n=1 Tax=Actinoalloteichus fjordicus TaxID=1612552 RepID=A0AAC9LAK8_9PSEU|nr:MULTISPECIES: ATP-binding protein [Actinoalloteichus]APU14403.1 anti-sigma regulatory factor (Ser/Thr protein kinase) [Actinoalloteichus fjordicus]APU20372.1 anti-sigma regulatory factor (Ser/Thr protein kinase) [Actinoalloteichus sp. GBA129-24]